MRFRDIRNALVLSWVEGQFGLPTAYPNKKPGAGVEQAQADNQPWVSLFVVPAQPGVATLGSTGQDRHDGFMQIDLNYPLDTGDTAALDKADEIATRYVAGRRIDAPALGTTLDLDFTEEEYRVWVPLHVLIRSCGVSQPRKVENWSRTSMTIYWSAWVNRAVD
ncbi:phage tail terminator-like protein [Alcanivoracaceae bacterium MT1]